MLKKGYFAYLSWLHKQTKVTWVIIGIFTFLLGVNIYAWWQAENNSAVGNNPLPADNVLLAKEEKTELRSSEIETVVETETKAEVLPEIEEEAVPLETVPNLPEAIYINPLNIVGYQAPCTGKILCPFGVNFDERYGDYRYHQGVVYQLSKNEVKAALAGTVVNIYQENGEIVLVLEEGTYQLVYRGMTEVTKAVGDSAKKGEKIGEAQQELIVEAIYYQ